MKKWLFIALAINAIVLLSTPVVALSSDTEISGNVPFAVYNITAANITSASATISWGSNAASSSRVFYDTASHNDVSGYSSFTSLDTSEVLSHSQGLTGLAAGTTYHFRVQSVSAIYGTAISEDMNFLTTPLAGGGGGGGTGGGGGGGGGAGGGSVNTGQIYLSDYMSPAGTFKSDCTVKSLDGLCNLIIPKGTVAKTTEGWDLSWVSILPQGSATLPPPEGGFIVGSPFKMGPDGATFSPPIIISFVYNETLIPTGIQESQLKIAYFNVATQEWIILNDCKVDTGRNTITASLSHFSIYAVTGYSPKTSIFSVRNLEVSPAEASAGEKVAISAVVVNNGDTAGTYEVKLEIDNKPVVYQEVNLSGHTEQTVTFMISEDVSGTYTIRVNELTGSFRVTNPQEKFNLSNLVISPATANAGQDITISAEVSNQNNTTAVFKADLMLDNELVKSEYISLSPQATDTVTFELNIFVAGVYSIKLQDLSGTLEVKLPPSLANFALSDLIVSPQQIKLGDEYEITANVSNVGDEIGNYQIEIRVGDNPIKTDTVSLAGHTSQLITYNLKADTVGTHQIWLNHLSAEILITEAPTMPFVPLLLLCMGLFFISGFTAFLVKYLRTKKQRS